MFFGGIPALGEEKVFHSTGGSLLRRRAEGFSIAHCSSSRCLKQRIEYFFLFLRPFLLFGGHVFEVRKYNQAKGDKMW